MFRFAFLFSCLLSFGLWADEPSLFYPSSADTGNKVISAKTVKLPELSLNKIMAIKTVRGWELVRQTSFTEFTDTSRVKNVHNDSLGMLAVDSSIPDSLVVLAVCQPKTPIACEGQEIKSHGDFGWILNRTEKVLKWAIYDPTKKTVTWEKPDSVILKDGTVDSSLLILGGIIIALSLFLALVSVRSVRTNLRKKVCMGISFFATVGIIACYLIAAKTKLSVTPITIVGAMSMIGCFIGLLATFRTAKVFWRGSIVSAFSTIVGASVLVEIITQNLRAAISYFALFVAIFLARFIFLWPAKALKSIKTALPKKDKKPAPSQPA